MAIANALNLDTGGVVTFNSTTGVFTGSSLTQYSPLIGAANNLITSLGPLTNGQLVIGSTGVSPVAAIITAGTGVTITNAAGSITIANSGTSAGAWTDEATSFNAAAGNGYFVTAAATATMPASPTQGQTIAFAADSSTASVITVQANTGQTIRLGTTISASAGTAVNTQRGDSITLVYRAADTEWIATQSVGSWTIT